MIRFVVSNFIGRSLNVLRSYRLFNRLICLNWNRMKKLIDQKFESNQFDLGLRDAIWIIKREGEKSFEKISSTSFLSRRDERTLFFCCSTSAGASSFTSANIWSSNLFHLVQRSDDIRRPNSMKSFPWPKRSSIDRSLRWRREENVRSGSFSSKGNRSKLIWFLQRTFNEINRPSIDERSVIDRLSTVRYSRVKIENNPFASTIVCVNWGTDEKRNYLAVFIVKSDHVKIKSLEMTSPFISFESRSNFTARLFKPRESTTKIIVSSLWKLFVEKKIISLARVNYFLFLRFDSFLLWLCFLRAEFRSSSILNI